MNQPRQSLNPINRTSEDEPELIPSPAQMWDETTTLVQDTTVVIMEGIEEESEIVYQALNQTFKWLERCREKLENGKNEMNRFERQAEAKQEALEKMKANSVVRETQAEIYALEQDSYEEARKLKELDSNVGITKAQIARLQAECQQLEHYEPSRSGDFVFGTSILKTKLNHELGFVQVPRRSKSENSSEKLFLRCDLHPESSRVVRKAENNRDGFVLANKLWDLISP
ncbi:hypothetical protein DFH28DRAFT_375780 [Melampsora americana]|nr:hypothetical protein DFH28DRAFT_375780 [Melampsora americana]